MISVLMSVYNESAEEIEKSIFSILSQTYKNFELIIVNDNPERGDLNRILEIYKEKDSRIVIIKNQENRGLAISMNIAFRISKGEYIARMDADDIAIEHRFQRQIDLFEHYKDIDLISTGYKYIDENDVLLGTVQEEYKPNIVGKILPYRNIIHHPTVMMKREIFQRVGGYRNFPCAQDYDLWLRMLDVEAKFWVISDLLHLYRIRENSITNKRWFEQSLTVKYIQNLHRERSRNRIDSFSESEYNEFIWKKFRFSDNYMNKCELLNKQRLDIQMKQNKIYYFAFCISLIFRNKFFRERYIDIIKNHILGKLK